MKLSTKSRYGTRLMLDLAKRYNKGPVQLGDIAKREDISLKYLEQILIPLRRANFVKSVRGQKGGYLLARHPDEITIGEIVGLLEGGKTLAECSENPNICGRSPTCLTRELWKEVSEEMFRKLNSITLDDLLQREETSEKERGNYV